MSGNKQGGLKAKQRNIELYGEDFYKRTGSLGGLAPHISRPFQNRELAVRAGRKAGKLSKRGYRFIKQEKGYNYYIANATGEVVKYKHDSDSQG